MSIYLLRRGGNNIELQRLVSKEYRFDLLLLNT